MNKIPTPLYQIFLNWINQYKENINLLVNPRILVTGEYPIDRDKKSQLMDADVEVCFSSNGVELYVLVPVFASFSLIDQKVHLSITYRDITRDDDYYFEGFVEEYQFKHLSENEKTEVLAKMQAEFFKYFDIEQIPMWRDRLLNSIIHDDVHENLLALDIKKTA